MCRHVVCFLVDGPVVVFLSGDDGKPVEARFRGTAGEWVGRGDVELVGDLGTLEGSKECKGVITRAPKISQIRD